VHVAANVLNALPKSAQPAARRALAEIRDAEDRAHAEVAIMAFATEFAAKWPKAVAKITDKPDALLAFFDFPAEHWVHLKTTNAIESTFATVRLRTRVTKGPGSKAAGLAMAYKLLRSAEEPWRAVNGPHLVALVRASAKFHRG
jgi:transposase-like protein